MIFIRPWFFLIILIPLIIHLFLRENKEINAWKKYIPKELLDFLIVKENLLNQKKGRLFFWIFWGALTIAGAGPAFQKRIVPIPSVVSNSVIVLDMGPYMDSQNLSKAKIKIYELLEKLKEEQIAFVLYDDQGYVISPLTLDKKIIKGILPSLNPNILYPINNPSVGILKADQLLKNVGAKNGRIFFITAGGFNLEPLKKTIQNLKYQVLILEIGENTPENLNGIKWSPNNEDINQLLTHQKQNQLTIFSEEKKEWEQWQDLGIFLFLFILPFLGYSFKKGYFLFILSFLPLKTYADFWQRPDQKEYLFLEEGNKAYRVGNFEKAIQNYTIINTENTLYNLGNALAKKGKIEEAISKYKEVLSINPNHKNALFNKEYLEKQLKNKNENQENLNQNEIKNQSQEEQETKKQKGNLQQKEEELSQEETSMENKNFEQKEKWNQEEQQILNRIQKDPSRILKFRIQKQRGL